MDITTFADRAADQIIGTSYAYYGVRVLTVINSDDEVYALNVGEIAPASREWDDNELTGELLPGTCALVVDAYAADLVTYLETKISGLIATYGSGSVVVLGSNRVTFGIDADEIVMGDAVVLAVA